LLLDGLCTLTEQSDKPEVIVITPPEYEQPPETTTAAVVPAPAAVQLGVTVAPNAYVPVGSVLQVSVCEALLNVTVAESVFDAE
jgi:cytoskeletal protein RodZ